MERSARVEEGKSRALGWEGGLQMSLELGLAAMRVILEILTNDVLMDMRALRTKCWWMIYRSCINKDGKDLRMSIRAECMNGNPNSDPSHRNVESNSSILRLSFGSVLAQHDAVYSAKR